MTGSRRVVLLFAALVAGVCLVSALLSIQSGGGPLVSSPPDPEPVRAVNHSRPPEPLAPLPPAARSDPPAPDPTVSPATAASLALELDAVEALRLERSLQGLESVARSADDARVRIRALCALVEVFGESAQTFLFSRANASEESEKVRAEAARLLGRTGSRAGDLLAGLIAAPLPARVRRGAALGLAEAGTAECATLAFEIATDENHPVRLAARESLGRMPAPAAARRLLYHVTAEGAASPGRLDSDTRTLVCRSLGRSRIPSAAEHLTAWLLNDRSPTVRAAAAEALGILGVKDSMDALAPVRKDSSPEVARAAEIAWTRLSHLR